MRTNVKLIVTVLFGLSGNLLAADFDSNGVRINYTMAGAGETVVLLHGFSGSADGAWINPGTFDAIREAGYRVVAMDHRGHGKSDKPHSAEDYGIQMAEDVRRLLDHLDVSKAHIVGYSMGAKIANAFRTRHPERLQSLVLGGYGWPWQSPPPTLQQARANMETRAILPGNDLDALAAYQAGSAGLNLTAADLRDNVIPTLSIVGTEDQVVPRSEVESLRATMGALAAIDMPGTHAGSEGALYKPQFGAEIIAFIEQK